MERGGPLLLGSRHVREGGGGVLCSVFTARGKGKGGETVRARWLGWEKGKRGSAGREKKEKRPS